MWSTPSILEVGFDFVATVVEEDAHCESFTPWEVGMTLTLQITSMDCVAQIDVNFAPATKVSVLQLSHTLLIRCLIPPLESCLCVEALSVH